MLETVLLGNYAGILEGTSRSEIHVDFRPAANAGRRRILTMGRNGSGKSTFMNSLFPLASQNDDRSVIIAPGRPGKKILTYRVSPDTTIRCEIDWTRGGKVSGRMFINDSLEESTKKGNITEYLAAVQQYFGLDSSLTKILRIGNRLSTFVDLDASKRKDFIGNLAPEVEQWVDMQKNAAKRLSAVNAELRVLRQELDRLRPKEETEEIVRQWVVKRNAAMTEEHDIQKDIGILEGIADTIRPQRAAILRSVGIDPDREVRQFPILDAFTTAQRVVSQRRQELELALSASSAFERFKNIPDDAPEDALPTSFRQRLATATAELKVKKDGLISERSWRRESLERVSTSLSETRTRLNQLRDAERELGVLNGRKTDIEAKISAVKKTIEVENYPVPPTDLTAAGLEAAIATWTHLRNSITTISSGVSNLVHEKAIQLGMDDKQFAIIKADATANLRQIRDSKARATSLLATVKAQQQMVKMFSGHCSSPSCPHERVLTPYRESVGEEKEYAHQLEVCTAREQAAEAEVADAQRGIQYVQAVNQLYREVMMHRSVYQSASPSMARIVTGPKSEFFKLFSASDLELEDTFALNRLLNSVSLHFEVTSLEASLARIETSIELIKTRVENAAQYHTDVENLTAQEANEREKLDAVVAAIAETDSAITSRNRVITLLDTLIKAQKDCAEAEARCAALENAMNGSSEIFEKLAEIDLKLAAHTAKLKSLQAEFSQADSELTKCRNELARRGEFESRLAVVSGRVNLLSTISDACHPSRGAPMEFLREFLNTTRNTVNELMDIAMNGDFRLDFVLTDREFRIPVSRGSGTVIPDIREVSEGQLALGKTVLSLALIEQALRDKSIRTVVLDEVDGTLDQRNRDQFASIVDELVARLSLQQVFIISHNTTIFNAPAGVVLFPGHNIGDDPSFFANKVVLADFS